MDLESAKGADAVWESFYREYVNDLYNYGIALGASAEVCRDAIHDVFYKLYDKKDISAVKNIKYFLLGSLKHRLIDMARVKRNVSPDDIERYSFRMDVSVLDSIMDQEERELIKLKVERLMSLIPPRQREIIYLRYMQELSYEEIGMLLNITAETARKLVSRGISKMREIPPLDTMLLLAVLLIQIRAC